MLRFANQAARSVPVQNAPHDMLHHVLPVLRRLVADPHSLIRAEALQLLSQLSKSPTASCDALASLYLSCAAASTSDPSCQFTIADALQNLVVSSDDIGSDTLVAIWSLLLRWSATSNWHNVRAMCLWAMLRIVTINRQEHLEATGEGAASRPRVPDMLWVDSACEACLDASNASSRLWGLRLIWAASGTSPAVLKKQPEVIQVAVRALLRDWHPMVREAAAILTQIIDGSDEGLPDGALDILGHGQPPASLVEELFMPGNR